jgi:hypothetical protein
MEYLKSKYHEKTTEAPGESIPVADYFIYLWYGYNIMPGITKAKGI